MVLTKPIDILDEFKSLDFSVCFFFFLFLVVIYRVRNFLLTHVIKWLEIPDDYGDIPEYF